MIPRINVKSHLVAREIVYGPGKNFVDWLPFEKTIHTANLYFRGGRPFSELTSNEILDLKKSHLIRNAIAHKSRFSLEKFEKDVISGTPITSSEKKPANYLIGLYRISPIQTRYELYAAKLNQIANKLTY
jgi:hypothetical protein